MRKIVGLLPVAALALTVAGPAAHAHEVVTYLSAEGLDFIEDQVPEYLPSRFEPPEADMLLTSCMGRNVVATQFDTVVELEVDDLDLSIPTAGVVRVELTLSVIASGRLHLQNPYSCYGEVTCSDGLSVAGVTAIVELGVESEAGVPRIALRNTDLLMSPDDIAVTLNECGALGSVATYVIDFAQGFALDALLDRVEALAQEKVAPMLEDLFLGYSNPLGTAEIESIEIALGGITVGTAVDVTSNESANSCIGDDPGEPATHAGPAPSLAAGQGEFGVAVNMGLIDDVIYHVWRRGYTCVTDEDLRQLGVALDLDLVSSMLPGFPPGTELTMDLNLARPPRMLASADGALSLIVEGVNVDLTGVRPDGSVQPLNLVVDAAVKVELALEQATGALTLEVIGVEIPGLEMSSQVAASDLGFDVARIHQVLHDTIIPTVLAEFGELTLTGTVFSFGDYSIILRHVGATEGFLAAKVDVFQAPASDSAAPNTTMSNNPAGLVGLDQAKVSFQGQDAAIPMELLRYRVVVNGVARPLSYLREAQVGQAGESGTYRVEISAVDLAGNEDPSPAIAQLEVDGVAPKLRLLATEPAASGEELELSWQAIDDLTPTSELGGTIEIHRLGDPAIWLSSELVETLQIAPGATRATVLLPQAAIYRVEVHVRDSAGNVTVSSVVVSSLADSGGCQVATRTSDSGLLIVALFAGLLAFRRRRRST